MTLLVAPFEARASADVEVHRNEFEIDHELRLEAAVDTFRDAGMLRDRTPVSTVDRKTLPRSLSALPDTAVRRAG
ncbi:hypothetical protein [Williamsia sterculiae]|nr:hypothetical protein [Williamsia sterculiae]